MCFPASALCELTAATAAQVSLVHLCPLSSGPPLSPVLWPRTDPEPTSESSSWVVKGLDEGLAEEVLAHLNHNQGRLEVLLWGRAGASSYADAA